MVDLTAIVLAASIPSGITGFCFWLIQHKITEKDAVEKEERQKRQEEVDKRAKAAEDREKVREQNEICIINSVMAAIALGEATARAVQRIPDAHCNGDMHAALDYASKVKHDQKEFLTEQGIKAMY